MIKMIGKKLLIQLRCGRGSDLGVVLGLQPLRKAVSVYLAY